MTPHPLTLPQGMRYDAGVTFSKGVTGVGSPNEAVISRSTCNSEHAAFFAPGFRPVLAARSREPQGSPVPHRSSNLDSGCHPVGSGSAVSQTANEALTMSNITTLAFENTTFEIVDQNGQPWLRATDVANALGYSRSDKVGRLYSRNADEFTAAMTAVIETPTSGLSGNLVTETRIFSLRGAHLLAMFARTEKAKAFRVWLLDLIETQASNTRPHNPAIDYDRISPAQAQDLKELVHAIAESKVQGFAETWARLHRKFRVNSYLELPATRFDEARDYLLGKLPETPAPALPDAKRLQLAFSVAAEAGAQVQRSVFEQLTNGAAPDMVHARTIAAVSFDRNGKPTIPWAQAMGAQEFITTADDLPRMLACRDVSLTDVQASHIIGACAQILSERATRRLA